ncbi:NUDIX domain-containing protein [Corynebacterium sp. ES2794-CONJ1]|uniref:NUDIX hydrolase n=1 Tax=unclassified Corynebacterium TaxID=2624378 RepID=UPI00216A49BB|nr:MULTISPECIES: NUDIX domain-containing protein [unclassified Corynebacterium]MCS4489808.1 NUDIX domain-containing protein [Corynebacterium sp. ES2775-CONJ]MCS4491828.1 NUDIX domain-containing protein [Corynebacterium sp. ES2715-CONJ3]MCS4531933.1 NUDIX domain-containing protein [Corynebacterium sp. ES2730-CONJ]MCU9519334.1 NUDIX domain-containing protein [Corynebacterium sp. ES2794-CONJ1]
MSPAVTGLGNARLAVTVLMIRDSARGLEVYIQERVSSMPTFPNATVFPGGGVDERDLEQHADSPLWSGPSAHTWSSTLGIEPNKACALIMAAGRELFEETGTLLASDQQGELIADAHPYHPQRMALESHRLSFSEVLKTHRLTLRSEVLYPYARWVSPINARHRFDMFSFIVAQPRGQEPDGRTREAASTGWFSPELVLRGWHEGLLQLVIPTWAHLKFLSAFSSVDEVLTNIKGREITPVVGDPYHDPRFEKFYSHTPPQRFQL